MLDRCMCMYMYQKRIRENWTQEIRKANLEKTEALIQSFGGYSRVLDDMHDFERYLAIELGCSVKTAREYVETVRGAQIFKAKMGDRQA